MPTNNRQSVSRRQALQSSLAWGGAAVIASRAQRASGYFAANDRPRVGAIGTGSRWCQKATGIDGPHGSAPDFQKYCDYVAVCDADEMRRELASVIVRDWTGNKPGNTPTTERSLTTIQSISSTFLRRITGTPRSRLKRCWLARTSIARSR